MFADGYKKWEISDIFCDVNVNSYGMMNDWVVVIEVAVLTRSVNIAD